MRLLPALLTTAVWFWAPAAFAAPPWTAPGDPVSGEHVSIERPRVFFADDGAAVATYSFAGDRGSAGGHGIAVRTPGAGEFAEPRTFTRAETLVGVLPFGRTHLVAATEDRGTLSAALGRTNGTFGRWQRVRTSRQMLRPSLAGDVRGDLALVWFENRGTRNDRVFVSLRRPGGRFGTPVLVATDRVRQTAVAVSSRGSVLVAWETAGRIRVRVRASDAKRFGRIQTLASRPTFGAIPRAAFAPNGRAYVAWAGQSPGEGASSGPVEVAIKPPTSSRFRAAQTLDESGHHPSALSMAVANDNGALVAWSDDGRIRAAGVQSATRFEQPVDLGDGIDPAVALGLGGRAVVAWQRGDQELVVGVLAAYRPPGAGFGPPEQVSDFGPARQPSAALGPDGPLVLLSNRTSGRSPVVAYAFERRG